MAADGPSERDPATSAIVASLCKLAPGSTWTDLETTHLIDAYEEKWNYSKRGPLKAQQWEDVAVEVAGRCGLTRPSKNGTQCRHKIEKLRKRYRSERLRPVRSLWPFFDRIDRMERGSLPISGRPPPAPASSSSCSDFKPYLSNKRSVNGILGEAVLLGSARGSRNARSRKRRQDEQDEEHNGEENEEEAAEGGSGGREGLSGLAAELRRLGEGYVRMERKRIEMMREREREWMEMESRKLEMVMEAQRGLVETIAGAFWKKGD